MRTVKLKGLPHQAQSFTWAATQMRRIMEGPFTPAERRKKLEQAKRRLDRMSQELYDFWAAQAD